MINKITAILTIITITLTITVTPVYAVAAKTSPTPASTTPSVSTSSAQKVVGEKLNEQINQLKERIASRVAELNLVEKRGIIGTVTQAQGNQITFTDLTGKTRYSDVDEITKFSSPSAKNGFGLSDLVKGTKISVIGLYNKQSKRILARYIDAYIIPVFLSGRIAKIDKQDFTITILSEDKIQTGVDIETVTKISSYTKGEGITKYGFSKLEIGDRVAVTGYANKDNSGLLSAIRVLVLSGLPENPKIIITEPTVVEENDTSTKSGKFITTPAKKTSD